jgi:hypothetical protein
MNCGEQWCRHRAAAEWAQGDRDAIAVDLAHERSQVGAAIHRAAAGGRRVDESKQGGAQRGPVVEASELPPAQSDGGSPPGRRLAARELDGELPDPTLQGLVHLVHREATPASEARRGCRYIPSRLRRPRALRRRLKRLTILRRVEVYGNQSGSRLPCFTRGTRIDSGRTNFLIP